ncbi:hypothetical protein KDA_44050 [Dictyobacter alpinus]|uniref:histidine kinase n=1 Tax=Dictyobacter alpinus TaxID=2014873 RepID=A0A402BBW9_9CHLR|nr:ATP-binding protein [Dictyobacter alpinus]GCE28921.1 hypothetical protein KDA_44050 [Dictyobacter alpinus]
MSQFLPLPWFLEPKKWHWQWYVRESLLALGSVMLVTALISISQLPQHLPDSLLVYLLVILVLAAFRGFYDAFLASLLAFFAFDLFFVAPVYSFQASKFEDVLSLLSFLLSALLTSYLASALHRRIESLRQKERETRLLYQLAETSNRQQTLELQLSLFSHSLVEVFRPLGLLECTFLLADADKEKGLVAVPPFGPQFASILPDETLALNWVREHGQHIMLHEPLRQLPVRRRMFFPRIFRIFKEEQRHIRSGVQLIPLRNQEKVMGILRLHVLMNSREYKEPFWSSIGISSSASHLFFSTLLEHVVSLMQQEQLRQERLALQMYQQTEKLRSALVTSVSHDLRKPLTTIKAAASTLLFEEALGGEVPAHHSLLTEIEREADWLDGLIENLLDMSRIESGVLQPQTTWYALDILLDDVLLRLRPSIGVRKIQRTMPVDVPPVPIDVVLIEQVLTNLLTNALHYTPDNSPLEIQLCVLTDSIMVRILDEGPGIPAEEQEHIFEKFYRLTPSQSRPPQPAGMGLGLAICRGIIEAHQGRIWTESRPTGGAVFAFTLPFPNQQGEPIDDQEGTHLNR